MVAARGDVAIVVPAWEAAHHLQRSLPAMLRAADGATVLVVDAGSTDATGEVAREHGAQVLRLPERAGPGEARNVGAHALEAEVLLFLDADCMPHPDVVERVLGAFAREPDLVALCGSYDTDPPEPGFFSQYMNLRHHFVHQRAKREPATFWGGCGAVRRKPFLEIGGFDAEQFPRPSIEDIELGGRLRCRGRTRLDPDLQVTHLKRWTLRSVVETDIVHRAIPWTRLILATGELPDDLNLRRSQRVASALAPLVLAALPLLPIALATRHWATAGLCAGLIGAALTLNAAFLRAFAELRGARFALGAWLFHQLHLFYSGATFALLTLCHRITRSASSPALETDP